MHIWVDADACPKPIRELLFRAAQRTATRLTLVANSFMPTPPGTLIDAIRVSKGFDVADDAIVSRVKAGDLVITADIPLAADVIERDALALNPRGELYTRENVRQRLGMRDFLDTLRGAGIHTGGPAALSASDRQQFANQLDRILARKGDR